MQMKGANKNARGSRINGEFIRVVGYDGEDEKERMTKLEERTWRQDQG